MASDLEPSIPLEKFASNSFLLDSLLSRLDPSFVELSLTSPSANSIEDHRILVRRETETLLFTSDQILVEKFPTWTHGQRKPASLYFLALEWSLEDRIRENGGSNVDRSGLDAVVLALVGAVRLGLGAEEAHAWLSAEMRKYFDGQTSKLDVRADSSASSNPRRAPQPQEEQQQQPSPPPPSPASLVAQAIRTLPPNVFQTIFTHPSIDPVDNLESFFGLGLSFLRNTVSFILNSRVPGLSPDRMQLVVNASCAPDLLGSLAREWNLDSLARERGRSPELFLTTQTEMLFFSLVGGTLAVFGDVWTGQWLVQVLGEYVRRELIRLCSEEETIDPSRLGLQSNSNGASSSSSASLIDPKLAILNRLSSTTIQTIIDNPETLASKGRKQLESTSAYVFGRLPFYERPSESNRTKYILANKVTLPESLQCLAQNLSLHLHPRLIGRVDFQHLDVVFAAVYRGIEVDLPLTERYHFIEKVIVPEMIKRHEKMEKGPKKEKGPAQTPRTNPKNKPPRSRAKSHGKKKGEREERRATLSDPSRSRFFLSLLLHNLRRLS
ncbi:hypothetical protein BDY24DRAFT_390711 [Mrakia frigida]|uniref:uncharacterized protein n=1 Tax=Mrakia frigida TaxID=29902 RepID=UPI003FCC18AF